MAPQLYATVRLDTDLDGSGLPINEYKAIFEGAEDTHDPAVTYDRSLTGHMHVHRLESGSETKKFEGYRYTIWVTGQSERAQLLADLGRVVYFMPNYRDESAAASYRQVMLFESASSDNRVDPMETYFRLTIMLTEATGNTP